VKGLDHVTGIMVSHDAGFLDEVCTHIIQIDSLKLKMFPGNLTNFVNKVPEARSYFEISASKQTFKFPQPGPLEGVKSKSKALMKMEGVSYRYPINDNYTITGMTVQVSLASRVGCVGPNGAGKSTMIKCLTGEVEPTIGTRWAHPSLRMAYVAQHAFHHIEQHLAKTPNEYIRWRYQNGDDKEAMNKVTVKLTDEEQKLVDTPFEYQWKSSDGDKIYKEMRTIEKLTMMRRNVKGSKEFEYEVKWKNKTADANEYLSASKLKKQGFEKLVMQCDQQIASRAGMYVRALTTANVEKHLEDVGLDREYGTHFRLNALSGGQKVKVVIGAAMWNQPHIVILDEPTNYLDRDSLGALAKAIIEYEGGVVIITHNDEFCRTICPERWVIEKMGDGIGRLDCQGDPEWMKHALDKGNDAVNFAAAETMVDAAGNETKVKQEKKKMSRKEEKAYKKRMQSKIKNGEPLDSDEEEWCIEHGLKE
jgi:elongation factor 3